MADPHYFDHRLVNKWRNQSKRLLPLKLSNQFGHSIQQNGGTPIPKMVVNAARVLREVSEDE